MVATLAVAAISNMSILLPWLGEAGAVPAWIAIGFIWIFTLVNLRVFGRSRDGFGDRPWSVYPLLGWGLGLALHGVSVFVLGTGGGLRERMVHKEREKLQRENERNRRAP